MDKVRVLFVCLGNICRSPAAEGVFEGLVKRRGLAHIEIDSAGTGGWHVGQRADLRMRQAAQGRGYDLQSRARQLGVQDFEEFDWILPMDNSNFENVMMMKPENCRARVIPFKDLVGSEQISGVPDPYYGGSQGFERVMDLLEEGCEALIQMLKVEHQGR